MLDAVAGRQLPEAVGQPTRLLATVLGQDLEAGEDGVLRIARKVVAASGNGQQLLRVTDPPRPLRAAADRPRQLSREVSGKRQRSANRGKAAARLGRVHARIRQVRQQFLHQVANQLVKTHDKLALEDLNVSGMLHNHRLAAAINDAAWAELARIISYKQRWRGGQVLLVVRWYPSTKPAPTATGGRGHAPVPTGLALPDLRAPCRPGPPATNLAGWAEQHHAQTSDPGRPRRAVYP